MHGVLEPQFQFVDLHDHMDPVAFEQFVDLYRDAFPVASEREEPELFLERLTTEPTVPQPRFHLLIARRASDGKVAGGLAFEFYRESSCALLTYVVIGAEYQRRGLAGRLLAEAKLILEAEANARQTRLHAIFAEAENPAVMEMEPGAASPWERLQILDRLGARRVWIPYVQPALGVGKPRARHLLLLVFALPGQPEPRLDPDATHRFLHEFYRALGVARPADDPDFVVMSDALRASPQVRPLWPFRMNESPSLELRRCSVCLHFVERDGATTATATDHPYSSDLGSMELDLLSHVFQTPAVCNTHMVSGGRLPVTIRFPDSFVFHSEGRSIELCATERDHHAEVSVSCTRFAHSGQGIWHLAIRPARGHSFSELDIIKLIHLYGGRSENTTLRDTIRFQSAADGPWLSAEDLLRGLVGSGQCNAQLRAGTVQIITRDVTPEGKGHLDLLYQASLARERNSGRTDDDTHAFMHSFTRETPPERGAGPVLQAYCGIVTGIFDYREIGPGEAIDTLSPIVSDGTTFVRFHRSTLISVGIEDRALEVCWDRVGASPYLFLPHAVLLHNEAMLLRAERALDCAIRAARGLIPQADAGDDQSLSKLESHLLKAESYLRSTLPNVFNYVTEQELFSRGQAGRGIIEQRQVTESKLAELRAIIESRWNFRRERRQMFIALLLAFVSVLQLKDALFSLLPTHWPKVIDWAVLCAGALVFVLAIFRLQSGSIRGAAHARARSAAEFKACHDEAM